MNWKTLISLSKPVAFVSASAWLVSTQVPTSFVFSSFLGKDTRSSTFDQLSTASGKKDVGALRKSLAEAVTSEAAMRHESSSSPLESASPGSGSRFGKPPVSQSRVPLATSANPRSSGTSSTAGSTGSVISAGGAQDGSASPAPPKTATASAAGFSGSGDPKLFPELASLLANPESRQDLRELALHELSQPSQSQQDAQASLWLYMASSTDGTENIAQGAVNSIVAVTDPQLQNQLAKEFLRFYPQDQTQFETMLQGKGVFLALASDTETKAVSDGSTTPPDSVTNLSATAPVPTTSTTPSSLEPALTQEQEGSGCQGLGAGATWATIQSGILGNTGCLPHPQDPFGGSNPPPIAAQTGTPSVSASPVVIQSVTGYTTTGSGTVGDAVQSPTNPGGL